MVKKGKREEYQGNELCCVEKTAGGAKMGAGMVMKLRMRTPVSFISRICVCEETVAWRKSGPVKTRNYFLTSSMT